MRARPPADWGEAVAGGPAAAYQGLRRRLVEGPPGPEAGPAFALLIRDEEAAARVKGLLGGRGHSRERTAALYGELMRAPAHPAVLFGYLKRRAVRLLARGPLTSRATAFGWGLASVWYACVRAYQATGERRFLGLLSSTFEKALAQRDCVLGLEDECRGGLGRGWGGTGFVRGRHTASITTTGRIAYPVLLFCRLVAEEAALERVFGEQASRFAAAVEAAMEDLEGDFVVAGAEGYYHRPASAAAEPLNHMAWAGAAYLALHALTGRPEHRERGTRLARFLAAAVYDDGAGNPIWDYDPKPETHRGATPERLWKAQVTLRLMAAAHEAGLVFTTEHLRAVGATLTANIFLPRGRINTRIDRVAEPFETFRGTPHGGYGGFVGLVEAEDFCAGIRSRIVEVVAARPEVGGWLGGDAAALGYARLLCPPAGGP